MLSYGTIFGLPVPKYITNHEGLTLALAFPQLALRTQIDLLLLICLYHMAQLPLLYTGCLTCFVLLPSAFFPPEVPPILSCLAVGLSALY